jgi:molybdopterin-guanine dinucleotide biosynthesis protein A
MDGQIEPLFAIWSSKALELLKENVGKGRTRPIYPLKALGKGIEPLYNTNTPEEWQLTQSMAKLN